MRSAAVLLAITAGASAYVSAGASQAKAATQRCGSGRVCRQARAQPLGYASRRLAPRLGTPERQLPGFGQVRPSEISFGGDPTSLVASIHWTHWGSGEAVGVGKSDWVWPGTCVGCNRPTNVRVVAFHLGRCQGHPSYNAFEWFFPQYGDTFKRGDYTNPCTHGRIEKEPPPASVQCANAPLGGEGTATEMSVQGISCDEADGLIAGLPAGPFAHEWRFQIAGYRCGTQGNFGGGPVIDVVQCAQAERVVTYSAAY